MRSRNFLFLRTERGEDDALIHILCGGVTPRAGAMVLSLRRRYGHMLCGDVTPRAGAMVLSLRRRYATCHCSHRKRRETQAVADNERARNAQHNRSGTVTMTVNLIKYCHGVLTVT